jgi:EmrB/QacA subfamily drug resistance transporter
MALIRHAIPRDLHLIPQVRHPRTLPTVLAMALAAGIGNFPPSAFAVALPTLHDQLNASLAELQWAITAYTLATSAFLIAAGRLADAFGRRLLLLGGTGLFVAGSALAALASAALGVIAGMVIAGLGFAAMLPASLSIVVNAYPPEKRGLPIGIWGAATVLFQGIAPLIGGALTGELSWRWIFWFQAAIAAVGMAIVLWATAESRNPEAERRIDVTGLALVAGALLTLSLAVIQAPTWGLTAPQTLILLAAALLLGGLFVVVEHRVRVPLVNFGFFRQANFTGATIVLFVGNFALIVGLFFLPLLLQEQLGYSATATGALVLPLIGAMVVMIPLGGPIAERIGPLVPIAAGLSLGAVGFFLLSGVDRQTAYGDLWLPMVLVGGGNGLALTPMNVAAMNAIHARESGAAGGVFNTLSGVGIGFGVAITGAVFNAKQWSATQNLAGDRGIHLSKDKAIDLDGLLAGASGAQHTLSTFPKDAQRTIDQVVHEAFVQALDRAFLVGGLVALGGLALALALIRRRPPADEPEPAPEAGARAD